ncbi:alcohol dehydrogenase [Vibrio tasmaniensis ZS-17]|uniref:nucleotidyltransferase family protein n=1 Tax=Vibrio TaxID=662 RepID=UPI0002F1D96C|nr:MULTISPECIES: nucleotidyltransferase family protein [Vibrio]OED69560.1 alcohol dehydrogenase [Vibrio tasmaniensis ZS-17]PMH99355.1 alcohol dehydrogenase [Vibrio lentus]
MIDSWKKVVLEPNATIRRALQVIDAESLRVVLVKNGNGHLIGVVTDGDIRRGLLEGIGLDDVVSLVMNTSPVTAEYDAPRQEILEKMNKLDILFLPIIRNGILVGLETLHDALVNKPIYENPVFIMAGGFGTRLKPLTDSCPKPMLEVGDKPILETLIKSFVDAGFINFFISTHYMPELIMNYFGDGSELGISITYIHEEQPLGTGGALGLLPTSLPKDLPLIMINGDVLTKVDFNRLLSFHTENNADATMCVREHEYQVPYGVITGSGNKIIDMTEKPIQRFFVNAGIYVVSPSIISSVPTNHRVDMPTLLEHRISEGNDVLMFPLHEYWLDIGQMDDFKQAQIDIKTLGL